MVAAPAARSMRLVGAIYGNAFSAERLIECGSVDCFLTSSNGYSLWAHYSIIVDWLGARIPRPNLQNQIILPISDSALRLLIDIIYHRKNYSGNKAILELIDYSLQCGWFQLMDDLLTNGFEEIEIEGLPRCWILARERNLECELSIRQRVGDNALTYIRQHSYGSEDFLSIPIEALLDLIDDDNISWPNGKTCLEVIFAWSLRNPRCAISYCKELFSVVRFKGIRECHTQKIEFINFFKNLGVEDATLRDATNGYLTMKPRLPRSLLVFMGGWIQRKASEKSFYYDIYSDHWSPIPSLYLPEKLSYFKCQIIKNKLYIVGGFSEGKFHSGVWSFDFQTLKWKPCAALNEIKGYFAVTKMNDLIYAIGGSDSRNRLTTFDAFDTVTNTWTKLPSLSAGKSDAAALAYRNRIWIFGGFDGTRTLSRVEAFDPLTRTWADMAPMNEPRSGHCAVLYNDKIFVIGGFQHGRSTNAVEYYEGGQWKLAPSMSVPRSNFDAVVVEGCIYVMGGHVSEESIGHCEKFDGHKWTSIHSLTKPIAAGGAIFIEKPPHISKLLGRLS